MSISCSSRAGTISALWQVNSNNNTTTFCDSLSMPNSSAGFHSFPIKRSVTKVMSQVSTYLGRSVRMLYTPLINCLTNWLSPNFEPSGNTITELNAERAVFIALYPRVVLGSSNRDCKNSSTSGIDACIGSNHYLCKIFPICWGKFYIAFGMRRASTAE